MERTEKSEIKIIGALVIKINVIRHGVFADLPTGTEIDAAIEWLNGFRKN